MDTRKSSQDDELHFEADQHLHQRFEKDEHILMSCSLSKYNKKQKCQERAMLITSKAIYNVNKFDFRAKMISLFKHSFPIRRRINIEKLTAITVSEISSEFVVHVKDEYDYRYSSPQRDKILSTILKSYEINVKKPLNFFFKEKENLHEFVTTEDDMKSGLLKIPTEDPVLLDRRRFRLRVGSKLTLDDFEILKILSRDSEKIKAVEKKGTKKIYIIKSIDKEVTTDGDGIEEETSIERYVLEQSQSPWIVKLKFMFETPEKFFLGVRHMSGGNLHSHLIKERRFIEKMAKFYAAEIILGLEYLHRMGIIYRNLKPEKILMDQEGHICLSDFGMSKKLELRQRTRSVIGTPEYLAPETVKGEEYGHSVDWWALGIMVFEMLFGKSPFYNRERNTEKIFNAIQDNDVTFPPKVYVSEDAKDFILQLLQKDSEKRLGSKKSAGEVKKHKWFADVNWDLLSERKVVPPFEPRKLTRKDYYEENMDPSSEITNV